MSQNTTRRRAREIAVQILYRYDVGLNSTPKVELPKPGALAREISQHFDHFQVGEDIREFVAQLVAGALQNQAELDGLLEKSAANWKIPRMSVVDRSLLRMATYELAHMPETDAATVIDEAVELAKKFGTSDTPAFVNGVLDAVKTALQATRASS